MVTIDQKIAELANSWEINGWPIGYLLMCVAALVLCVLLVGVIGIEREWRGRSAGLRTHLLVGVGSTVIMIISIYGFPEIQLPNGSYLTRDVARLAAQVITGVGFLGAGAIIHHNNGIKGLTTAGTIWVSMAIGIACGSFNFILAVVGTLLITLVLVAFKKVEARISKKNPTIILVAPGDTPLIDKILVVSKKFDCSVHSVSTTLVDGSNPRAVEITFQVLFESGEERLNEYLSALEAETKAINIHILSHH